MAKFWLIVSKNVVFQDQLMVLQYIVRADELKCWWSLNVPFENFCHLLAGLRVFERYQVSGNSSIHLHHLEI